MLQHNRIQLDETDREWVEVHIKEHHSLGTVWEFGIIGYKYELKEIPMKLRLLDLQTKWESFSEQFVKLTDITDKEIQIDGTSLHSLFINNKLREFLTKAPTNGFLRTVLGSVNVLYKVFWKQSTSASMSTKLSKGSLISGEVLQGPPSQPSTRPVRAIHYPTTSDSLFICTGTRSVLVTHKYYKVQN